MNQSNPVRKAVHGSAAPFRKGNQFERFAHKVAVAAGHPVIFFVAFSVVVVWVMTGPIFHFSDTWQLVINTGTTIVTFLMVFLIQQSQNRDAMAVQVKLAELIIAVKGAENKLATAEDLSERELEALHRAYCLRVEETFEALQVHRARKRK